MASLFSKLQKGSLSEANTRGNTEDLAGPGDSIVLVRQQRVHESLHPKTKGSLIVAFEFLVEVSTHPDNPPDSVRKVKFTIPTDAAGENKRKKTLGNLMLLVAAIEQIDVTELTSNEKTGFAKLEQLEREPFCYEKRRVCINTSDDIRPEGQNYTYKIHTAYPATEEEVARIENLAGVNPVPRSHGGFDPLPGDDDIPF